MDRRGRDATAWTASPRMRAAVVSLVVGVAVLATKFGAAAVTGSTAALSDALESVVNVAAAALLVFTLRVAHRPADRDHPYGHGKAEYFSAGIEGALIAVAALLILVEAGRDLVRGPELRSLDAGLALLLGAGVANAALGVHLLRVGRREDSPALVADGRHVLADVWTTGAVLAGLLAVRVTGWAPLDPLIAIGVALNLLREGFRLARSAVDKLMDAADDDMLDRLAGALERRREPSWIDVHGLRAWRAGREHHVDLHLIVPRFFDVPRLHGLHDAVEGVLAEVGEGDVVVHFDPCTPGEDCRECTMPGCALREQAPVRRPELTRARITRTDPEVAAERDEEA